MYEHIYIVGQPKMPLSNERTLNAEVDLLLPQGYEEYMGKFRAGAFCGIAQVWSAEEIMKERESHSTLTETHIPWWKPDLSALGVDENYLQIADSLNGDGLLFDYLRNELYLFTRGTLKVEKAGKTLLEGLTTFAKTVMQHPFRVPFFLQDNYEIYSFQANPEAASYKTLVESVNKLNIHSEREVHEFEAYFFVPEISGLINIYDTGCDEINSFVYGDSSLNPPMIERIYDNFIAMGCTE